MTNGQTRYNTALYLRLSKDDGTDSESSSIQTQKEMLTRYCRENGFAISEIYVDDGWSGTNSNRPSFQRMLSDIEHGKINCVITKDLSRLGRNYLETGGYTEVYFPEHNVRYIAVTDGVDTAKGSTMDITPFKNLLNDMYAQDISKKIKSSLLTRQKQGKFIGVKAPYGYVKDPADKNHLLIDERFAPTVGTFSKWQRTAWEWCRLQGGLRLKKSPVPWLLPLKNSSAMTGILPPTRAHTNGQWVRFGKYFATLFTRAQFVGRNARQYR